MNSLRVAEISKQCARHLVRTYHYSGRVPGIAHCWGLLEGNQVVGCVVYSIPASYTLCKGVCGEDYKLHVLELSRLVILTNRHCAASQLVGESLELLPPRRLPRVRNRPEIEHGGPAGRVVVSYADCNSHIGHVGYIYQATNWLYTGQANAEPLWVDSSTNKIVSYTRRHIDRKARDLGYDWKEGASSGPGLRPMPQEGKYRYVIFTGSRLYRRYALRALRYKVLVRTTLTTDDRESPSRFLRASALTPGKYRPAYPKGQTRRHDGRAMADVQPS